MSTRNVDRPLASGIRLEAKSAIRQKKMYATAPPMSKVSCGRVSRRTRPGSSSPAVAGAPPEEASQTSTEGAVLDRADDADATR